MLHRVKHKAKALLKTIPAFKQFEKKKLFQKRFETEIKMIKGNHINYCKHPSIIHFSFNKAATQYIKSILKRCVVENGMVPVDIHAYSFHTNFPYFDQLLPEEMEKYKHIFKKEGYMYSSFGAMIENIPDLEKYKVLFITRDPRDILVSLYYSVAYSHTAPDKDGDKYDLFLAQRTEARDSTIDKHVISESDRLYTYFIRYQSLLLDKYKNTYLTSYEQMATDFKKWLDALLEYCELDVSRELYKSLLEENERSKTKKENIYKQLRKGQPGDYKEKLKRETINYLDKKFESILSRFHYTISKT